VARVAWEELLPLVDRWEPDYGTAERVKTPNFRGFIRLAVDVR
jgi:hypothetical protein